MPMRMTGARRAALVLGGALAMVLIGLTVWQFVTLLARQHDTSTRVLPATGSRLTVEVGSGSVSVTSGNDDEVRITRRLEWSFSRPRLTEVATADGVLLTARCGRSWNCTTSYEVVVPSRFAVELRSSGGSLAVRGVTGAVRLRSSGGRVTASDVSGQLDLRSSAGAVRGEGLRSTEVAANSSGGRVQLTFALAPELVSATSSAGSVTVTVPAGSGPYQVDAGSSAGSTQVRVPTDPAADRRITARSSGGEVRIEPA